MEIKVEKLTPEQVTDRGIASWPIWAREASRFEWFYNQTEECLLLEGRVVVETGGQKMEVGQGDFVTFPKGLACVWDIKEPVRKHYNLREL